jgi:hypothetical protein
LVDYKELRKANGDIFFEAKRSLEHDYIFVNWIGIQTLETVVMGGNHILTMLKDKPSTGILNSNRELIGPWEIAVNWLSNKWVPQAKTLGLKVYAHVLSPGIYGRRSYKSFAPVLEKQFDSQSFSDESSAELWLQFRLAVS